MSNEADTCLSPYLRLMSGYDNLFPIIDFRALWSLSLEAPPSYNYDFWLHYTQHCREQAGRAGVRMRTLDRALWQYSQEHQKHV